MPRLVIKENMGLQYTEDPTLLDSTEEERVVCHDAPTFQSVECALVRRSIPCGYYRNPYTILISGVRDFVPFLDCLNFRHPDEEFFQRARIMGPHDIFYLKSV